uniref:MFS domain-containing protein n=2 Tax=Caenorhabditis japonica TaxID=281687 RepID=A0A8R1I752_CAEJA
MPTNKVAPAENGAQVQKTDQPPPYVAPEEMSSSPVRPQSSTGSTTNSEPEFQGCWTVVVVSILFVINLLNYMDRYTVAGVLDDVQKYYSIDDAWAGLIQTTFMIFFIIFSPICGFLGDRYNRKWIFVAGIAIWVSAVFASTFAPANTVYSAFHIYTVTLNFEFQVAINENSYPET